MINVFYQFLTTFLIESLDLASARSSSVPYQCSVERYFECVRIAEPLLKQADYVLPESMDEIDAVCKKWNKLILCLSQYTDNCFSSSEKSEFHQAIGSAIDSVHLMCTDNEYQQEFLTHAICVKPLIMETNYCGLHYEKLVDHVALNNNLIDHESLCCSYWKFKNCLNRKTEAICRTFNNNENVTVFVENMIDKSLNFLQNQCWNLTDASECYMELTRKTDESNYFGDNQIGYNSPSPAVFEIVEEPTTVRSIPLPSHESAVAQQTRNDDQYGRQLTANRIDNEDDNDNEPIGRQFHYETNNRAATPSSTQPQQQWYPLSRKEDVITIAAHDDIIVDLDNEQQQEELLTVAEKEAVEAVTRPQSGQQKRKKSSAATVHSFSALFGSLVLLLFLFTHF